MPFYESGTLSSFMAQVQAMNRITIPYKHIEIMGIKKGDYVDVSIRKLKKT